MAFINHNVPFEVSVGDISVTPPTLGTSTQNVGNSTGTPSFSSGAYRVTIRNIGGQLGNVGTFTVNGQTLQPGQEKIFQSWLDEVNNIQKMTPAITIVNGDGVGIWYEEIR